jgi:hypothetical protein
MGKTCLYITCCGCRLLTRDEGELLLEVSGSIVVTRQFGIAKVGRFRLLEEDS